MSKNKFEYIHGFSEIEQERLLFQNQVLSPLIYENIDLNPCTRILEIGCGVGAQMIEMLTRFPHIHITGVDISEVQVGKARINLKHSNIDPSRYELHCMDITQAHTLSKEFEAVIMIWVLEHVSNYLEILSAAKDHLIPNGQLFLTEVYNDSLGFFPPQDDILLHWNKMNAFQKSIGGNGNIGIELGSILKNLNFQNIEIKPYPILYDTTKLELRTEFFEYWISLMESGSKTMIDLNKIQSSEWEKVKNQLIQLSRNEDAVFFYNFIQAFAFK